MEGDFHIVDFAAWCDKCKHKDLPSHEDPCDECISISARVDSRKPEKWEEK